MPPASSRDAPSDSQASLQRRAHLPPPPTTIAAIILFIAWIVVGTIVGAIFATEPGLESSWIVWRYVLVFDLVALIGLRAGARGRAQPGAFRILSACLLFFTLLPLYWTVRLMMLNREEGVPLLYGGVCLLAGFAALSIWVVFTFGQISRFYYRMRRSRSGQSPS